MIDPWSVPDRIPPNDEPDLISYDRPEVDEDRAHEEYVQREEQFWITNQEKQHTKTDR